MRKQVTTDRPQTIRRLVRWSIFLGVLALGLWIIPSSLIPSQPPIQKPFLPLPPTLASLQVTNLHSGQTLRYPVAMLLGQGTLASTHQDSRPANAILNGLPVQVFNQDNPRPNGSAHSSLHHGRFMLLVELVPGRNRLRLSSGTTQTQLTLTYKPATSPHRVVLAYVTPSDGDFRFRGYTPASKQDYEDRLDTAAKLMQTFTAEQMNRLGLGRKTFNLELNKQGRVIVHTLRYPATRQEFRQKTGNCGAQLIEMLGPWIANRFSPLFCTTLVIPAIEGPGGGRGGGCVGLVEAPHLSTWPRQLSEAMQAGWNVNLWYGLQEIGVGLHELGHCFGAEHSADPKSIMSDASWVFAYAFQAVPSNEPHWEAYDLAHFYFLPMFQPEHHGYELYADPFVRRQADGLLIRSRYGIGALQLYQPSDTKDERAAVYIRRHYLLFRGNNPKRLALPLSQVKSWIGTNRKITLWITDRYGNTGYARLGR